MTLSETPDHIDPPCYFDDQAGSNQHQSQKQHVTSIASRRLTGRSERPPLGQTPSSSALNQSASTDKLDNLALTSKHSGDENDASALLEQVTQWLQQERSRRAGSAPVAENGNNLSQQSAHSEHDQSLANLEDILSKFAASSSLNTAQSQRPLPSPRIYGRRASTVKALFKRKSRTHGSDTDGADAVATVPHIEASLDNTKTLAYSGGAADTETNDAEKTKSQKNWDSFKEDTLRLTHTLGLRGWRRLDLVYAPAIHIERLSGALTNAVYVVRPPKDYTLMQRKDDNGNLIPIKRQPKDLLLRIYGPQVEHLIDRDNELMILRRLAAKNIGPKLLGYFDNGRFEEFLHAKTLEPQDLRDPTTSKQIAKRMKELHEGIDLLEAERRGGPFVFANWDKWVDRVEQVMTWLDRQVHDANQGVTSIPAKYTRRGLICGAEWKVFKEAYNKYRAKLVEECGGKSALNEQLVFAHNDTQYGNLMRLKPADESPLVQAVNSHKQLVVIDFEYSNANTPGLEFANHFTEWCYNYHDPERPWACTANKYPTPEEQHRFVKAYVMHRPQFAPSASATPNMEAREKTGIPAFTLDARASSNSLRNEYDAEEEAREKAQEREIERLLHMTRLWRIANSALWTAWGIVQAKIPELDEPRKKSIAATILDKVKHTLHAQSDPLDSDVKQIQEDSKHDRPEDRQTEEAHHEGDGAEEEEEDFDYLAYSQDRAMFFWGDCVQMGIVEENDLPEETRSHIKYVKF